MNLKAQLAIAGVAGLVAGTAIGYLVADKKAEAKWRKISDEEVESVKDTYNLLSGTGKYEDPEVAVAAYRERTGFVEQLDKLEYLSNTDGDVSTEVEDAPDSDMEPEEKEAYSAWSDAKDKATFDGYSIPEGLTKGVKEVKAGWIDEIHNAVDTPKHEGDVLTPSKSVVILPPSPEPSITVDRTKPYLITGAEMFEQEHDYTKSTITYYQGDQTLTDERDEIIHKVEETVGVKSLSSFGADPMDPDVVYVRNHQLLTDFEILRNDGTFIGEVHGIHMQNGD